MGGAQEAPGLVYPCSYVKVIWNACMERKISFFSGVAQGLSAIPQGNLHAQDQMANTKETPCFFFYFLHVCMFVYFVCVCVCLRGTKNIKETKINQQNMADFCRSSYSSSGQFQCHEPAAHLSFRDCVYLFYCLGSPEFTALFTALFSEEKSSEFLSVSGLLQNYICLIIGLHTKFKN